MNSPSMRIATHCKACHGDGSTFTVEAHEGINPSVKSRWMTCDRCGGDGVEPEVPPENEATKALEDAARWFSLVAKTGKTEEQRERAKTFLERLEACIKVRMGASSGHTAR